MVEFIGGNASSSHSKRCGLELPFCHCISITSALPSSRCICQAASANVDREQPVAGSYAVVIRCLPVSMVRGQVLGLNHLYIFHPVALKGPWCSGITSAPHAEGPGLKSQCVHNNLHTPQGILQNHITWLWMPLPTKKHKAP